MASTDIPKVTDTDIERDDLEEAAQELGIEEFESLGDQELFEAVGRHLGEIEDEDDADASDDGGDEQPSGRDEETGSEDADGDGESGTQGHDDLVQEIQADLEAMTRDELREELRGLGLPVSGSKAELAERLEAVRVGQASAGSNGQAAADAAGGGTKAAKDHADEATSQAEDTAEEATSQAEDTVDRAEAAAGDSSDEGGDEAPDDTGGAASDEVTEDRKQARDRGEYRVEEDQREEVKPILDLELGPLALDLLGLDVHLNRVHAVLVANPGPKHALLGKLLAAVAVAGDKLGLQSVTDTVTDGVESVVDALPTPDTGIGDDEEEDEDGGSGGILSRLASAGIGAARSAVDVVRHGTDALGNAKDAAKHSVTSGGKLAAAKDGKDAVGNVKDAAESAKNVATGGE